jgi:hypothetical protein
MSGDAKSGAAKAAAADGKPKKKICCSCPETKVGGGVNVVLSSSADNAAHTGTGAHRRPRGARWCRAAHSRPPPFPPNPTPFPQKTTTALAGRVPAPSWCVEGSEHSHGRAPPPAAETPAAACATPDRSALTPPRHHHPPQPKKPITPRRGPPLLQGTDRGAPAVPAPRGIRRVKKDGWARGSERATLPRTRPAAVEKRNRVQRDPPRLGRPVSILGLCLASDVTQINTRARLKTKKDSTSDQVGKKKEKATARRARALPSSLSLSLSLSHSHTQSSFTPPAQAPRPSRGSKAPAACPSTSACPQARQPTCR